MIAIDPRRRYRRQANTDWRSTMKTKQLNWKNVAGSILVVAMLTGLQGCATLTEEERMQIEYDLNDARAVYEDRRRACLKSDGYMVTETLTGSRRFTISELKWSYCRG